MTGSSCRREEEESMSWEVISSKSTHFSSRIKNWVDLLLIVLFVVRCCLVISTPTMRQVGVEVKILKMNILILKKTYKPAGISNL